MNLSCSDVNLHGGCGSMGQKLHLALLGQNWSSLGNCFIRLQSWAPLIAVLSHFIHAALFLMFVSWLRNAPPTCLCISWTDLPRQLYVLPHWGRSCRSNFLSDPITVFWHRANQFQHWPYNIRCLTGSPLEYRFLNHWYDSTRKKPDASGNRTPGLLLLRWMP